MSCRFYSLRHCEIKSNNNNAENRETSSKKDRWKLTAFIRIQLKFAEIVTHLNSRELVILQGNKKFKFKVSF